MAIVSRDAVSDPALAWFREAKFGMFVHFGLYSLLGRGEWVQYHGAIPRDEYEVLLQQFNPAQFDADQWVDVAAAAGCRYITLTAKHHDGFCLFDSALTDFKITKTPFGRDLVGELTAACQRRGIRICFYYSQPDWHHPNFVHLPQAFKDLDEPPSEQEPDWPRYLEYCHGQVHELCTNYGRIDGIWFDGSHKTESTWQGRRLYQMIKSLQPTAIVNDRARYGDIFTPERSLPDDLTGYMFEACQSICQTSWGHKYDAPQFSVPNLVENLVRVAGKGGNFLLNVGPMADGTISTAQTRRMQDIGRWMAQCGEGIYASEAGTLDTGAAGIVATRKADAIYLFLCRWPDTDSVRIPGLRDIPEAADLLPGQLPLDVSIDGDALLVRALPMAPPLALIHAIRLRYTQPPKTRHPARPRPRTVVAVVNTNKPTVLGVANARPSGLGVKGAPLRIGDRPNTGRRTPTALSQVTSSWAAYEQKLTWTVEAPQAMSCDVGILLACPRPFHGATFVVRTRGQKVTGTVRATHSFRTYRWQAIDELRLHKGMNRITLYPTYMPYGYIFANVVAVKLTPLP